MTLLIRIALLFVSLNSFAGGASDLRNADLIAQQKNIRIIYSDSLNLSGTTGFARYAGLTHSVLTEKQLIQIDQQLRQKNFATNYKADGCYAKSHLISYELSRVGIKHSKVLVYGPNVGDIQIIDGPKTYLFQYHISPLVLVKLKNGIIKPFVLDLSFFNAPVDLTTWDTALKINSNTKVLKSKIVGPENIDHDWVENDKTIYSNELLYRFETEIDAFNLILKNQNN